MDVDPSEGEPASAAPNAEPEPPKNAKKKSASETYTKVRRAWILDEPSVYHVPSCHKSSTFSRGPIHTLGVSKVSPKPCGLSIRTLSEWLIEK